MKVSNAAAFLAMVLVNALADILPLNGKTTGEISDSYPTLVTPAGYVFSIWGLIYALLLIFVVAQALKGWGVNAFLGQISFLFVLSCFLNVLWLFLWHYEQVILSVVPMFALLLTLITIYLRLGIGKPNISTGDRISFHLPFSIYMGWITVASIVNVAAALVYVNWSGGGLSPSTWAVLVIVTVLIITSLVMITRRDIAYGLVIVWALIGILVKQAGDQNIVTIGGAGILIIAILAVAIVLRSRTRQS